jgi:hypothetical protein
MSRFSITGLDRMSYEMVPGADPLDALLTAHRDGLGFGRVRLEGGRFVFADPSDREMCAGACQVTAVPTNHAKRGDHDPGV